MNATAVYEIVRREVTPRIEGMACPDCEQIPIWKIDPSFTLMKLLDENLWTVDGKVLIGSYDAEGKGKQLGLYPLDDVWNDTGVALTCDRCKSTFFYKLTDLNLLDKFKHIASILRNLKDAKDEE